MVGKALIFVPMQEEMEYAYKTLLATKRATCARPYDPKEDEYAFLYTLPDRTEIAINLRVIGDHGNLRTATRISQTLLRVDPYICLLVGIAGSMDRNAVRLGDVVISTRVKSFYPDKIKKRDPTAEDYQHGVARYYLDPRKRVMTDSFFRYRREAFQWKESAWLLTDYLLHNKKHPIKLTPINASTVTGLPEGSENEEPGVQEVTIFSSEMVIDCDEYIAFLNDKNVNKDDDYYVQKDGKNHARERWFTSDIPVADMETLGFLQAVDGLDRDIQTIHAISIRGISDYASKKQELDLATSDGVRHRAVANALEVGLDMINFSGGLAIKRAGR